MKTEGVERGPAPAEPAGGGKPEAPAAGAQKFGEALDRATPASRDGKDPPPGRAPAKSPLADLAVWVVRPVSRRVRGHTSHAAVMTNAVRLPESGLGRLMLGGRAANAYFARLDRKLARPAKDASFSVDGSRVL